MTLLYRLAAQILMPPFSPWWKRAGTLLFRQREIYRHIVCFIMFYALNFVYFP